MFSLNKLITGGLKFARSQKDNPYNLVKTIGEANQIIAEWLMGYAFTANFAPTLRAILAANAVGRAQVTNFSAFSRSLFKIWLSVVQDDNLYNIESVTRRQQFESDMSPATVSAPAEAVRAASLPAAKAVTGEQGTYYTMANTIREQAGWMPAV